MTQCPVLTRIKPAAVIVAEEDILELLISTYERTVGTRVSVSCVSGQLQGPANITCLSTGAWSGDPSCKFPEAEPLDGKGDDNIVVIAVVLVVIVCVTLFIMVICILLYRTRDRDKLYWSQREDYPYTETSFHSYSDGYDRGGDRSITRPKYRDMPIADYNGTLDKFRAARFWGRGRRGWSGRRSSTGTIHFPEKYKLPARAYDDITRPYDHVPDPTPLIYRPYGLNSYNSGRVNDAFQYDTPSSSKYGQDSGISYIQIDSSWGGRPSPYLWRGLPRYV